jgi:hypothetical protein
MDEIKIEMLLPSPEHLSDLKERGIDIEAELARIVCDNLKLIKAEKNPRKIGIAVSKKQMEDLQKYGINGAEYLAVEFRKQMHSMLTNKRKD